MHKEQEPKGPPRPRDAPAGRGGPATDGAGRPLAAPAGPGPEATPAHATRRGVTLTLGIVLAVNLLAFASCVSFLNTCSLDPTNGINQTVSGPRAQIYWWLKYGEWRPVSATTFPRHATSIPWPNVDTDHVVVNLGAEGSYDSLVLIDLKTGEVSDNHQSAEVQRALDALVRDGLASFEGTGAIVSVAVDEGADAGDATGGQGDGLLSFNSSYAADSPAVMPEDAPASARMFFTARYDGDAEAFVQAERAQGRLDMRVGDIVVGLDVERGFQTGAGADGSAAWRADTDPVRSWLHERFDGYPQVVVLPQHDAEYGLTDSPYRLGVYPSGHATRTGAGPSLADALAVGVLGPVVGTGVGQALDAATGLTQVPGPEGEPLVDNWVTFGEESEIRLESDEAGVVLTGEGVEARRLEPGTLDLDALMGDSYWALTDVRDVYAVTLTGEALAQARASVAEQDSSLASIDLRMSLTVPGFAYEDATGTRGSDGAYGTAEYERNYYAYVMEVASVDDAGNVVPATDQFADADQLRPEVASSGGAWGGVLRDPEDTLLVVVARKAQE